MAKAWMSLGKWNCNFRELLFKIYELTSCAKPRRYNRRRIIATGQSTPRESDQASGVLWDTSTDELIDLMN